MSNTEEFAKNKQKEGKPQLQLLDPAFLEEMARICEAGNKKHANCPWRGGLRVSDVMGSLLRHAQAINKGEMIDEDSGLPHAAHVAVNAMFIAHYYRNRMLYGPLFDQMWSGEAILKAAGGKGA